MGIVNPKVKTQFLKRQLDDWDWLKRESKADLTEAIVSLDPRPRFGKVKLWVHQKVCFLMMVYLQRVMLFLDMGGGKTLLILMLLRYLKKRGDKPKAIVFVPYVITVDTWIEETEKWTKLKCVPLVGTAEQNMHDLQTAEGDLFVICYQSAVSMLSKKTKNKDKKAKKKILWELDGTKVRKVFNKLGFTMLVMDEIHKCKNPSSMTYRMCRAISKEVSWAFGLTGTPFGKNLEDLWAQFFLIDHGETLGKTLGLFRQVFFKEVINYWGGFEYKFVKKLMPELQRVIRHRSIRYKIDECHDMPKRNDKIVYLKPNADVASYYNNIIEGLEKLSFGKIKFREVESQYMKLRQLASGFMTLKGDDSSKAEIKFPENPKLDALQDLIESMPEDSKMIVFHDFVFTNGMISERLKQMKVNHARVWGKGKNNLKELRRFKKDQRCRVLVINCQSGSSSQNLQMANYVVYFEQPRSAIDRQQADRRAWRPGQKKRVFFFDLLMKDTVDEKQYQSNKDGEDLLKTVLDRRVKFSRIPT